MLYGHSSCPENDTKNDACSRRAMAQDMMALMRSPGHDRFAVAGHDGGAGIGYRMARGHPQAVSCLAVPDIVPTHAMWHNFTVRLAMRACHRLFLAQPHPLDPLAPGLGGIDKPQGCVARQIRRWSGQYRASETRAGVASLLGRERDLGVPAVDSYIEGCRRRTGRIGFAELSIHMAYDFFRLAAILQGILGRVRDGSAANADAAAVARQVRPLAETAWCFARKAGA
ncbi:hypothetical protein [Aestuariivirga sp.]|uniref:alpha/beta fold hydrolase n=1 Tax=Aestuariivirga sp. TaxID=2650926 RepID=UPI0025BCF6FA|nr:hypothetical protein [Aestuariivirga sp.]MCA3555430.1 hypothetical protein [Aestuariivirga sp.]